MVLGVVLAISFCHLLNDMMQSLLQAIYPNLKQGFGLSFGQIGLVSFVYQVTASLLQPLVGLYADRRAVPLALPGGTLFTLVGLVVIGLAKSFGVLLAGAALLGVGSSVFHPESSRVARMAAGPRHGLAQSLFQVGGNVGGALGPLVAAVIVAEYGRTSLAVFALTALLSGVVLWNVGIWYREHGLARLAASARARAAREQLPRKQVVGGIAVLVALMLSKFVYLASVTSYLTFYLIERFRVSVQGAQLCLFAFLAAVALGTLFGGHFGDRFGRKRTIWFSILGVLPFTVLLPHANLFWSGPLVVVIGLILASAFPAIVVFAQELVPGRVGMISGLFFGLAFGAGGIGAAILGAFADRYGIESVYSACAYMPAIGLLAALLPNVRHHEH
jgi:FSR family fosmidomycin resistance protein-like MFS transporter